MRAGSCSFGFFPCVSWIFGELGGGGGILGVKIFFRWAGKKYENGLTSWSWKITWFYQRKRAGGISEGKPGGGTEGTRNDLIRTD